MMKQYLVLALKPLSTILLLAVCWSPVFAQKSQSEREFDGLKGAVKTEVMESAKVTIVGGKQIEEAKQTLRLVNYDEAGNRTKVELFEDGFPHTLYTYSDLNGSRVVKSQQLRSSEVMSGGGGPARRNTNLKPDTSFTMTHTFKLDAQGRRVEVTVIDNNGKFAARRVFKYNDAGQITERSSFTREGKKLLTTRYTIDSNGNVVEESHDNMIKYSYAYEELDEEGNWTKQVIKSVFKTRGKPSENHSVTYRKLSYY